MKRIMATVLWIMAGCRAEATLRSWSLPTEQDNFSITRSVIDGRVSFVVGATIHVFVMIYDGTNWVTAASLNHPGSGTPIPVEDTDVVLTPATNKVDFHRIIRSGGTLAWSPVGTATVSATASQELSIQCASSEAALCLKPAEQQVWFVRIGTPAAQLDIPADASYSAHYATLSNSFLAAWESGGFLEARRYDAGTGGILASNHWPAVGFGAAYLRADGLYVWTAASNTLTQYSPESLTAIRSFSLPECSGLIALARTGSDLVVLANAVDGTTLLLRINADGDRVYNTSTALTGLEAVAPDGIMALNRCNNSARLLRLADGEIPTHHLFSDGGPDTGLAFASAESACFGAKACFWWDGVEIQEVDPVLGPWQGPSATDPWPFSLHSGRVNVFPLTSIGSTSTVSLVISNSYEFDSQAMLFVKNPGNVAGPFRLSQSLVTVPGTGKAEVAILYAPTNSDPSYAAVQIFRRDETMFSVATLAGRPPRDPLMPMNIVTQIEGYARAQARGLTNAATINVACGWPRSWYSASHSNEGYVVMHEVGLADLGRAIAAERGWITGTAAWSLIGKSLDTMEILQSKTNEFRNGNFFRYYWIRHSDGSDRLPDEVTRDPNADNHPSSDDNALLVHSLLLVRALAIEQQQAPRARQIERILRRLDLRRFLTADENAIAMWRDPSGAYSPPPHWDTIGTEGTPIAAALVALNQLSSSEYTNILGHMSSGPGWYRDIYVPYGDYHASMFVRLVRSLSGLPVAPEEAKGATYWMSLGPLLRAHLSWSADMGIETILSHVMSQQVDGVPQTGRAAGNTQGVNPSGQTRSGPHAWFIPFARPQWLDAESRDRLLAMMTAYEPLYFTTALGWECAVPFTSAPPHQGTDAGPASERVYELLNSMYILLASYDMLRIHEGEAPLSARHPLPDAMAQLMEHADQNTSPDIPPLRLASASSYEAQRAVQFISLGQGLTNFALQTESTLHGMFTNNPALAYSNRWGGVYESSFTATIPRVFIRVVAP